MMEERCIAEQFHAVCVVHHLTKAWRWSCHLSPLDGGRRTSLANNSQQLLSGWSFRSLNMFTGEKFEFLQCR